MIDGAQLVRTPRRSYRYAGSSPVERDASPYLVSEHLSEIDEGAGHHDRLERGVGLEDARQRDRDAGGEFLADVEIRFQVVMLDEANPPDLRERRENVILPDLPLTPYGQAVRLGLLSRDAKSRDNSVPQNIDVRWVVIVALRHERVIMREQRLAGLPSRDFVAALRDRRVDLFDNTCVDGGCCPPVSGPALIAIDVVRMTEKRRGRAS